MLTTLMWGDSSGFRTYATRPERTERVGAESALFNDGNGNLRKPGPSFPALCGPLGPERPRIQELAGPAREGWASLGSGPMATPGCGFCDVVEGRADVVVVARTEHTIAFLDRSPVFYGHTLVIPHEHHETLMDLPREL